MPSGATDPAARVPVRPAARVPVRAPAARVTVRVPAARVPVRAPAARVGPGDDSAPLLQDQLKPDDIAGSDPGESPVRVTTGKVRSCRRRYELSPSLGGSACVG